MLKEAAGLPGRCPFWYAAMMQLALQQGWSKAQTKALLQDAITFEPGFYHVYRYYANYLQPKWYGTEGEVEAFADEISNRIGGSEGAFIYFEIATVVSCGSCGTGVLPAKMSWAKIKDGYAAMEQMYGTSNLKMNRFAYMDTKRGDKVAARGVFVQIGDHWEKELWEKRQAFEIAKSWAMAN